MIVDASSVYVFPFFRSDLSVCVKLFCRLLHVPVIFEAILDAFSTLDVFRLEFAFAAFLFEIRYLQLLKSPLLGALALQLHLWP